MLARRFAAEGEGPYPVWWEPVIEYAAEFGFSFEKLEDAEKLLTTPFPYGGMWVARKDEPEKRGYEIHDCATFKRLAARAEHKVYVGVGSRYLEDHYRHGGWGVFCQVLEQLSRVIPAKKSFVRDFVFDENALDYLPAFADSPVSGEVRCMAYFANLERVPLRQFLRRVLLNGYQKIEMTGGKRIELYYKDSDSDPGSWIGLLARGDFNHDGLQDILLHSGYALSHSRHEELFTLSRDATDAVFNIPDAERHIRQVYSGKGCDNPEQNWAEHLKYWEEMLDRIR